MRHQSNELNIRRSFQNCFAQSNKTMSSFASRQEMSPIYAEWLSSRDKGNARFWQRPEFRRDYTSFELAPKKEMVYSLISEEMQSAIMSTDRVHYRVLSLGCGPGTDMLAAMDVFQTVCRTQGLGALSVKATGVDFHDWPLRSFDSHLSAIEAQGPITDFQYRFCFNWPMRTYVDSIWDTEKYFDFIILSFAEVRSKIDFVAKWLPPLLRDEVGSRIFVIDNNIPPVRQLEHDGFRKIGVCAGRTVCMAYCPSEPSILN